MYPQPSSPPSANSTIIIHDAPTTQIDFAQGLDASDQLLSQDCIVYGNNDSLVGVKFCLAASHVSEGSVLAGKLSTMRAIPIVSMADSYHRHLHMS